jgi:hypothetical protein
LPFLIVGAVAAILDGYDFGITDQGQENINVNTIAV